MTFASFVGVLLAFLLVVTQQSAKWLVGLFLGVPGIYTFTLNGTYNVRTIDFNNNFINIKNASLVRNDHTTVTAPLPVCSAKLSTVGPG